MADKKEDRMVLKFISVSHRLSLMRSRESGQSRVKIKRVCQKDAYGRNDR